MLSPLYDYGRTFNVMDDFRRRMDRLLSDWDADWRAPFAEDDDVYGSARRGFPRVSLTDAGENLVLRAELPGFTDEDVKLSLNQNVLALGGSRKGDVPQGYVVHRKERAALEFTRSFTLPCKVDPEKTSASIKDGILTVTLAKAPEAQPRQIAVRSQ